jgi:hypothetical protein
MEINNMEDLFKTAMMIIVSGALGYVVGNSLRYSSVVSDQKLMKQKVEDLEKELVIIKAGEARIFEELKNLRGDIMESLSELRLEMKDKMDRD